MERGTVDSQVIQCLGISGCDQRGGHHQDHVEEQAKRLDRRNQCLGHRQSHVGHAPGSRAQCTKDDRRRDWLVTDEHPLVHGPPTSVLETVRLRKFPAHMPVGVHVVEEHTRIFFVVGSFLHIVVVGGRGVQNRYQDVLGIDILEGNHFQVDLLVAIGALL